MERRGQDPIGLERIHEVSAYTRAPIYSLHVGTDRAATWYDQEEHIVWLVGVGLAHDYNYLRRLAERGRLLPTVEDYDRLEPAIVPQTFAQSLLGDVDRLIQEAQARPDRLVVGLIADRIPVRVCVESDDPRRLVVAISTRIAPGDIQLPPDWVLAVGSAFFPHVPFNELLPPPTRIDDAFVEDHELALHHPVANVPPAPDPF